MAPGNAELLREYLAAYESGGLDAWAAYCEPKTSANVVQLRKQNSSRP